jgi:hypothetical protein
MARPNWSVRRMSGCQLSRNAEGANPVQTAEGDSAGFWRVVDCADPPTEGERRGERLISQVTGQKGGRPRVTAGASLPPFFVG